MQNGKQLDHVHVVLELERELLGTHGKQRICIRMVTWRPKFKLRSYPSRARLTPRGLRRRLPDHDRNLSYPAAVDGTDAHRADSFARGL